MANRPHGPGAVFLALAVLGTVWVADAHAKPLRRPSSDLDGWYLTLGPVATAISIENSWDGAAGGEVSVVRVAERRIPAAVGMALGGVSYSERKGGRLWLDAELAFSRHLPVAVGLGLGVTAEVDPVRPPRWGAQGTLWVFAGIIPFVRVGTVEEAGAFFEVGLMLKIPVKFRY